MGTIHTSVAAVIKFTDAILEKAVMTMPGKVTINTGNKIVWKDSGCVVVLKQPGTDAFKISIDGGIYKSLDFSVDLRGKDRPAVYNIWLTPSEKYPFTPDMTVIRGESSDKKVYMARISNDKSYKLIADVNNSELIRIWGMKGEAESRKLLICEDDKREIITLSDRDGEDKDGYILKTKTKNSYNKKKTLLYPVTEITTGSDGKYIMAYKNMSEDETVEVMETENR